ncbi:ArnT family glycosyltransferase [Falsiroseomonas oryziterrae]|uniref:ArnT family glycosyltransferase n=1 Tax=Falsiroseomonas oryziterrae TaxID=2911368 RepID=UPI001F33A676|nr:glycosyltransferase family 39 protein [Roseomonas sp. NPKOSM-4]
MNPWLAALAAVTALRLVVAAVVPLAPDEAYYWVWSRTLQGGYLDHPPMVALFIRAGTLLAGETPIGIRLMGPLSLALASILLARAADALFPRERPGAWAAALLNATLMIGVGGILATPDTPLVFFWICALWTIARLHATGDGRWWLAFGFFAGLALASKYTAVLLGLGVLGWLIGSRAAWRWWRDWRLYAGGALALLVFAPVLAWNAAHDWASFAKQGGRAGVDSPGITLRFLGELFASQVGLATPIVFVLCVAGVAGAVAAWARRGDAAGAILAAFVLPGVAVFLWQATGSRVQGNWPIVLYPAACIAAAAYLPARLRGWRWPALGLGAVLALGGFAQAALAPVPLPRRQDPTLARLGGWDAFAEAVEAERRRLGASFVAAEEYGLASQLALRLPPGVPVVALHDRWALFDLPRPQAGVTGLLVQSERRDSAPDWPGAEPARRPEGALIRARRGVEAERYRTFRVETRPDLPPAAILPRPLP